MISLMGWLNRTGMGIAGAGMITVLFAVLEVRFGGEWGEFWPIIAAGIGVWLGGMVILIILWYKERQ